MPKISRQFPIRFASLSRPINERILVGAEGLTPPQDAVEMDNYREVERITRMCVHVVTLVYPVFAPVTLTLTR